MVVHSEVELYHKALDIINDQLMQALKSLQTITTLYTYREEKLANFQDYESLFFELKNLSSEKAILCLSNIVVDDRESISIHSTFRYFCLAKNFYNTENFISIAKSFDNFLNMLQLKSELIKKVKFQRDRFIAHFDKKNVNPNNERVQLTYDELSEFSGLILDQIMTINDLSGIGNEMWDLNYWYGITSAIDKILKPRL